MLKEIEILEKKQQLSSQNEPKKDSWEDLSNNQRQGDVCHPT
jgi:hypothetical protein